jgi:hypothetical protein
VTVTQLNCFSVTEFEFESHVIHRVKNNPRGARHKKGRDSGPNGCCDY